MIFFWTLSSVEGDIIAPGFFHLFCVMPVSVSFLSWLCVPVVTQKLEDYKT